MQLQNIQPLFGRKLEGKDSDMGEAKNYTLKATPFAPSYEEITARAQQLWRIAGNPAEHDLEFWLAAENEAEDERGETNRNFAVPSLGRVSATCVRDEIDRVQSQTSRRRLSR